MAEITKKLELEDLPKPIQDWLASDTLTYTIDEINKRLALKALKTSVIPLLIFELATKEIAPENFIQELAQSLNISYSSANILTQEIKEKMLRPIERDLRSQLGIDVAKIALGEAPVFAQRPTAAPPTPPPPSPQPVVPTLPAADRPFIIHEEIPTFKTPEIKISIPIKPEPQTAKLLPETSKLNNQRVVHYSNLRTPLNK